MTTSDKIKELSIYSENQVSKNNIDISYITHELVNKLNLRKERERKLCEILNEEFIDYIEEPNVEMNEKFSMKKMSLKGIRYNILTDEIILTEIIDIIINKTINKFKTLIFLNEDIVLSNEWDIDIRRISTRVNMLRHLILQASGINATFILMNPQDSSNFIDNNYNINLKLIQSDRIPKGKIIIGGKNNNHAGIYVNKSNNILFIKETPDFYKNLAWFDII